MKCWSLWKVTRVNVDGKYVYQCYRREMGGEEEYDKHTFIVHDEARLYSEILNTKRLFG